jgi:hypothetical protein
MIRAQLDNLPSCTGSEIDTSLRGNRNQRGSRFDRLLSLLLLIREHKEAVSLVFVIKKGASSVCKLILYL